MENNNVLERQIEKYQLEQILTQQESMLESLIEYRDNLYSLSFNVGKNRKIYKNLAKEYIRNNYHILASLIDNTRDNIRNIKKRLCYLDNDNLRKINIE